MKPSSQYLLGEFLERREVKERLVLADVVLGVVRDVLARRLESVHLQVDPEIEVEVVDVDEVGEVSAVTPAPTMAPPTALPAATPKAISGAIGERTYL